MRQTRQWTIEDLERPPWVPVQSGQIKRVAWVEPVWAQETLGLDPGVPIPNGDNGFLLVEFHAKRGPSVYAYDDAPPSLLAVLVGGDSPGKALSLAVKGRYEYLRLEIEGATA